MGVTLATPRGSDLYSRPETYMGVTLEARGH